VKVLVLVCSDRALFLFLMLAFGVWREIFGFYVAKCGVGLV